MAPSSKQLVNVTKKMVKSKWVWIALALLLVLSLVWKYMSTTEGFTCNDIKSTDFKQYNFERRRCSKKDGKDGCKKWKCRKGWEDTGCDWGSDKNGPTGKYGAMQCRKSKTAVGKLQMELRDTTQKNAKDLQRRDIADAAKDLVGDQKTLWEATKNDVEWRCPGDDWIWDPARSTKQCYKPDYDRRSTNITKNAQGQSYNPDEFGANKLMVKGEHWNLDKWKGSTCILWHKHRNGQFKGPGRGNIGPSEGCTGWNPKTA